MRDIILSRLADIASTHRVAILYACESGSRGWGFASEDSDYDVRFLYLHPIEWYVSIRNKRDVIELPISQGLDIVGWDFRKTLQLFQLSNPRLFDWIAATIVYAPAHSIVQELWALVPDYFSPFVFGRHYGRMARHYFNAAIDGDQMHVKNIFYALRSVVILKWVEEVNAPSPMSFWQCVERVVTAPELLHAIQQLFVAKQASSERASIPTIPVLEHYCRQEIKRLEPVVKDFSHRTGPDQPLDRLFQKALLHPASANPSLKGE